MLWRARVATSVQGNPISVSVNGTTIAAALSSPNVGPYVLVANGTVTLQVNGQPVTPTIPPNGTPTVAPGGDVTVLLTGTGTTATLLADDNTPSSSTAKPVKLRLVNGLNGTTGQASLTLNNGFVASGVALGAASPYTLVVSSAGLVTLQATIGTGTFYLNPTATLNAGGVYTLFLLGDGSSPPSTPNVGILFTDR